MIYVRKVEAASGIDHAHGNGAAGELALHWLRIFKLVDGNGDLQAVQSP